MKLFQIIFFTAALFADLANAQTRTLRIVTYNIDADSTLTNNQPTFTNIVRVPGPPLPGLIAPPGDPNNAQAGGVLEGIGEERAGNDPAQPLDILALQETTSNPDSVAPVVNGLNTFYGLAGMYASSPYQATESGGFTGSGNGPNAIVFNTRTVQLLASVPLDPPGGTGQLGSGSGEYREVMRYQFAPAGVAVNVSNVFYIYVSHYKSGTGANNSAYRLGEAQIIRNNAGTLPAGSRILYTGDFNTGVAAEGMYVTLIAPGTNQAMDPVNPAGSTNLTWDDGSSALEVKTYSPSSIHYRDDYQMMTTNVYYGTSGGLALVPGTYHVFGNNGSLPYLGKVTADSNTALSNRLATNGPVFISAAQLYLDLTGASDHLPVVADYTIPLPAPVITSFNLAGTNLMFNVANGITGGVYTVWTTTNLALPFSRWTVLATNVSDSGNFNFTVTNALNRGAPQSFYLLQTK